MPAKISQNNDGSYEVATPNAIEHGWEPGNTKHEKTAKKYGVN